MKNFLDISRVDFNVLIRGNAGQSLGDTRVLMRLDVVRSGVQSGVDDSCRGERCRHRSNSEWLLMMTVTLASVVNKSMLRLLFQRCG